MHDRNGTPLKKGDKIMLPAIVTDCQEHPDYCNVTIQSVYPVRGSDGRLDSYTLNTGQVVLLESAKE